MFDLKSPIIRSLLLSLLFLFGLAFSVTAVDDVLEHAAQLTDEEQWQEAEEYLLEQIQTRQFSRSDQCRIYVQLAQNSFYHYTNRTFNAPFDTDEEAYAHLDQVIGFAEQAIELNGRDSSGYLWRGIALGRKMERDAGLGALKWVDQVVDDFTKVINLDPEEPFAYEGLAALYFALPGWPISVGDKNKGVALYRKAFEIHGAHEDMPAAFWNSGITLAHFLWDRNMNVRKRKSHFSKEERKFDDADGNAIRAAHYEGSSITEAVPLYASLAPIQMTDRQEAVALLRWLLTHVNSTENQYADDYRQSIISLLQEWDA